MSTVIRITRHQIDADRESYLKNIFGSDLRVVTDDIRYGDDPVGAVVDLIKKVEAETGDKVVAVETQAPFPVLMRLVDCRRDIGLPLIRAQFERDVGGRAIVVGQDASGRDLLKFSHYEVLERIVFETTRLEPR
ncbi:MAG: hypothetical protein AAB529_01080 [Patescibacteria group bacterium]